MTKKTNLEQVSEVSEGAKVNNRIIPTIGRIVWYYPGEGFPGTLLGDQPCAADVVYVQNDDCVNLNVKDHNGACWAMGSVTLVQEDDEIPFTGYAMWMPYQVGQAKKHEVSDDKSDKGSSAS